MLRTLIVKMPGRRTSSRLKGKADTSSGSGEDNMELKKTKVETIKEVQQQEEKKINVERGSRKKTPNTRSKLKRGKTGYEADSENTTDSGEQSDIGTLSQELYDFNLLEDNDICLELFPDENKPTQPSSGKRKRRDSGKRKTRESKKETSVNTRSQAKSPRVSPSTQRSSKRTKLQDKEVTTKSAVKSHGKVLATKTKSADVSLSSTEDQSNTNKQTKSKNKQHVRPFWESLSNKPSKKRKSIDTYQTTSQAKKSKPYSKSNSTALTPITNVIHQVKVPSSKDCSPADSGVFTSPPSGLLSTSNILRNTSTPSVAKTSTPGCTTVQTPSILLAGSPEELDSAPNFESFMSLSSVSPVKPVSKIMQHEIGSPKLKTPIAERTYSSIKMNDLSMEEKHKKRRKGGSYTKIKVDNWAAKMNSEFDDLESYELSID